jgi:hypothetical protein
MMIKQLLIFSFFFTPTQKIWGDEYRVENIRLSETLYEGPFLIFDCKRSFFACVSEEDFKDCAERRMGKLKNNNLVGYYVTCAPLKKFKALQDCIQKQKELIEKKSRHPYCYLHRRRLDSQGKGPK